MSEPEWEYAEAINDAVLDITYRYDPRPEPPQPPPGVTKGYLVMWSGKPGPARVAEVPMLVGEDGERVFGDGTPIVFRDCTVTDGDA